MASLKVVPIDAARERRDARAEPTPPLTKKQIAAHCGVSVGTITRWMKYRGMPFEKPFEGGSVRFRLPEVDAWLHTQGRRPAISARPLTAPRPVESPPATPTLSTPDAELLAAAPAVEAWVDIAAVAAHLACSEEHIRELAKRTDSRRIPHRKEGRRLLFKLSRVDRWLERDGGGR